MGPRVQSEQFQRLSWTNFFANGGNLWHTRNSGALRHFHWPEMFPVDKDLCKLTFALLRLARKQQATTSWCGECARTSGGDVSKIWKMDGSKLLTATAWIFETSPCPPPWGSEVPGFFAVSTRQRCLFFLEARRSVSSKPKKNKSSLYPLVKSPVTCVATIAC